MLDEKKNKPFGIEPLDDKQRTPKISLVDAEKDYRLQRYATALAKFEAANKSGNPYAAIYLCYMHLRAQGVPQNIEKAKEYFYGQCHEEFLKLKQMTEQERSIDERGKYFLLLSYYCLRFFDPEKEWVAQHGVYLANLIRDHNARALTHFGNILGINHREAAKCYRLAAAAGDEEAFYNLGWCYEHGKCGVPKNWQEATKWYSRAVSQGYPSTLAYSAVVSAATADDKEAQYMLAEYYASGQNGLEKNMQRAVEWYTKAAQQGHAAAFHKLGDGYLRGEGTRQDLTEAARCFRESGLLHFFGKGTPKDLTKAAAYFIYAASLGDGRAAIYAAWCALSGQGLVQDPDKAFGYLNQSIELKSENAFTHLLLGIYYNYYARPPKVEEAAKAYYKAYEHAGVDIRTYTDAQVLLAQLLEKQQPVQNIEKVRMLYLEAARLGNRLACHNLVTWNERHPSATPIPDLDVAAYQIDAQQSYTKEEKELGFAAHYLTFFFQEGIGIPVRDGAMADIWRKHCASEEMESARQPASAAAAMSAPVSGSSPSSSSSGVDLQELPLSVVAALEQKKKSSSNAVRLFPALRLGQEEQLGLVIASALSNRAIDSEGAEDEPQKKDQFKPY